MSDVQHKVVTKTPNAAVFVWNYIDRLGSEEVSTTADVGVNDVEPVIISTASLVGISTSKSKSNPDGKFELQLAPTKNWVSTLTPGSWLCILMTQDPIEKEDLPSQPNGRASPDKVKMIGKIESVRAQVRVNSENGARRTVYSVTGVDWGYIFENKIYVDPFIDAEGNLIGSATFLAIFDLMKGDDDFPAILTTDDLIIGILNIIGGQLNENIREAADEINRLAKATYSFKMPKSMINYLNLTDQNGNPVESTDLADAINFFSGKLEKFDNPDSPATFNPYKPTRESSGYIDPTSFKGANSLWQVMTDNSNPVVNELLTDMRWNNDGTLSLSLYNRIKPFIFDKDKSSVTQSIKRNLSNTFSNDFVKEELDKSTSETTEQVSDDVQSIISKFNNVRRHKILLEDILSLDAGTNWRDKYNFVEVKPSFQDFDTLGTWLKTIAQSADTKAFSREGFRPLVMATKQFPSKSVSAEIKDDNKLGADLSFLAGWKELLRFWYFDTHKMLNGSIEISGQNQYIQVGDNIMFSIRALGITPNITSSADENASEQDVFIMAHVEKVSHNFSVDANGARTYRTEINFVRGIVVNENGVTLGEGTLDSNIKADAPPSDDLNNVNVFGTSGGNDPDPQKLRGS